MFTLIDKCYHRPRSCDLLQELREVQEAMKELKKKEQPELPVGTPDGKALGGMCDWLYNVISGSARIDSAPRHCWDYVQQDGQNSDVAFTEYLYKLADYIREIADCRENWENYKTELTTLSQREIELKKLMGIE